MIWDIRRHEEIGSTNDEALSLIRRGDAAGGEVIVARRQRAGRGRHGREWVSDEGGLWMTAVLPALAPLSGSGLAVGAAVCRALDAWGVRPRLKWPNDVEVGKGKLGGILVEHVAGQPLLAAGIGLNVANRVPELTGLRRPAVALAQVIDPGVGPEELLEPLLAELAFMWREWRDGGWPAVLAEIRRWDGSTGRRVRAVGGAWEGTARGLDEDGALLVRADAGRTRRVDAGEVEFL